MNSIKILFTPIIWRLNNKKKAKKWNRKTKRVYGVQLVQLKRVI